MLKKIICTLVIVSLCLLTMNGFAQTLEWQTFTSVGTVEDLDVGFGSVWGATDGGALQLDMNTNSITKLTNVDGLTSNEVVAVEIDKHGSTWFALSNGVLNRYFPETDSLAVIRDYENQTITDMVSFGDSLYIGLDFGVSLYTINKKEVKETYTNLGLSSGEINEKIAANSISLNGIDIWVATNRGIAKSSLDIGNLQAPTSWIQYTSTSGLPSDQINRIAVLDSIPYAATTVGVARLLNGQWQSVGLAGVNVLSIKTVNANNFFTQNTVVARTSSGIFWLNPADQWQQLGTSYRDVTAMVTDENGNVWIGRKDKGLALFQNDDWQLFTSNVPASNNFKDIALDSKGRLWCASQVGGVHMWDGTQWRNFDVNSGLTSIDQRTVLVDAQDRIWFGSWGGGITIFTEEADGFSMTHFDTTNGILAGADQPTFVVINELTKDQFGNVWALNPFANNNQALVAHTPTDEWVHFSTNDGLPSTAVTSIEVDDGGRIWIGTENNGIKVLDHKNTLFDKTDDNFQGSLTASVDGLVSNRIHTIAEDQDNVIWIGTDDGINFWFNAKVGQRFGLIDNFVNTIAVDARNNKWFGTVNGVSVLSSDGVTWTHYTTSNSPLVSSNVQSFAFNEENGDVWIGTTNGLSLLKTPFTAPQKDLSLLTGFPNPFIINGVNSFVITNLAVNTDVSIFSVSGKIVREFKASEIQGSGQVFWDGRDKNGELVASGIYVYLAFSENGGISGTGKVAVVRQ